MVTQPLGSHRSCNKQSWLAYQSWYFLVIHLVHTSGFWQSLYVVSDCVTSSMSVSLQRFSDICGNAVQQWWDNLSAERQGVSAVILHDLLSLIGSTLLAKSISGSPRWSGPPELMPIMTIAACKRAPLLKPPNESRSSYLDLTDTASVGHLEVVDPRGECILHRDLQCTRCCERVHLWSAESRRQEPSGHQHAFLCTAQTVG